jgi:hypothetical protein
VKHGEKLAPVAAAVSALSCLVCCLPFGIAAAAGAAGLSVVLDGLRPYLLVVSGGLLAFGLWQLYHSRACRLRTRTGLTVFWVSAVVVTAVAFAPQIVGSLLAGGLPFNIRAYAADLDLRQFQAYFNAAANETRLVVLLSPT